MSEAAPCAPPPPQKHVHELEKELMKETARTKRIEDEIRVRTASATQGRVSAPLDGIYKSEASASYGAANFSDIHGAAQ